MRNVRRLEKLFKDVLVELNVDLTVGDLKNTPKRIARTWLELTRSYAEEFPRMKKFPCESTQVLGIHGLHYFALCEHHGLPFEGKVCVLYVPDKYIIGVSKPARIVDYFSHKLMIQERFTKEILEAIKSVIYPLGIYVIARGRHLCSSMRGIKSREHLFVTEQMWFKSIELQKIWERRLQRAEEICGESVHG